MRAIWKTFFVVVIANLIATTGDICVTWTSPIYPKLYSNDTSINPLSRPITTYEDDLLGSILSIGAILGPIVFGIISEKIGRKKTILLLALPHALSFVMLAIGKNIYVYVVARFISGLAVGAGYALVPLYAGEIAERTSRGAMISTISVFWCLGDFLILVIGPYTPFVTLHIVLTCFPIIFVVLFSMFGVESPYYLISVNKQNQATNSLMFLRSNDKKKVTEELEIMKGFLILHEDGNFSDLLKDMYLLKYLLVCLFLLISQSLGGFFVIIAHIQPIFESAGTNISSDVSAIIVGGVLLATSFTGPFLMDKTGRRPLLLASFAGMCVSLFLLGTFFYLYNASYNVDSIKWLPLLSLASYIAFFNLGTSNVPWTILSELFPNKFKNIASSVCTTAFWLTNFIINLNYNRLTYFLGISGLFWLFSICCLVATIFSFAFVPETKGKTFSDIQKLINGDTIHNDMDYKVANSDMFA